jgi:NAD(P)-dependent dehydrogenase (short-subunit alcohol dehydrogenase family)
MSGKLKGKIVLVTGGTSGIGVATAQRFVKEGAYVFVTGRRQAELDVAARLMTGHVTAVKADASNLNDLDRLSHRSNWKKGGSTSSSLTRAAAASLRLAESQKSTSIKLSLRMSKVRCSPFRRRYLWCQTAARLS